MKAIVKQQFPGQEDGTFAPRMIEVGEVIVGDLARVAVANDWADEVKVEEFETKAKPAKKRGKK